MKTEELRKTKTWPEHDEWVRMSPETRSWAQLQVLVAILAEVRAINGAYEKESE